MSPELRQAILELVRVGSQLRRVRLATEHLERERTNEVRKVERAYVGPLRELRVQEDALVREQERIQAEALTTARRSEA